MARKVARYMIRATDNMGQRRVIGVSGYPMEFETRAQAQKAIDKILSKPGYNIGPGGRKIKRTAFRDAQSGGGINNPRIVKRMVFR